MQAGNVVSGVNYTYDVNDLASGIYTFKVDIGDRSYVKKFIVNRN